jgi:hypothetical protein
MIDLSNGSAWSAPDPALLGPWGTEGPEILVFNSSPLHMYFDCTFQPTPVGFSRVPYGMATAPNVLSSYSDTGAWTTVRGSCTGNDTSRTGVSFPEGATHGGFVCVGAAQRAVLLAKWGRKGLGAPSILKGRSNKLSGNRGNWDKVSGSNRTCFGFVC